MEVKNESLFPSQTNERVSGMAEEHKFLSHSHCIVRRKRFAYGSVA